MLGVSMAKAKMASFPSFVFCFWSLVLTSVRPLAFAAPWIVTELYEETVVTNTPYYWQSSSEVRTTIIQQITPTVTKLPEAISTTTSTGSGYYASDITVVEKLYPTGIGNPVPQNSYAYGSLDHSTIYYVNLVFSAPTECSTQWTATTTATVIPPVQVASLLPRTSVSTSVSVDSSRPFQPTSYTVDLVGVDPTQIPGSSMLELRASHAPMSRYSGSGCEYSLATTLDNPYSNYGGYNGEDWFYSSYWTGISPLALTVIIVVGWTGLWLFLGFIEAWFRFRRLMTGWQTRRGLPVCWAFMIMPLTCLLLCFFRKGYRARTQAEAAELKKKWTAMSVGKKLRLFFIWGFRYKYPPMLGPAPARVKMSKDPSKNPNPPLLNPTRPRSVASAEQTARSAIPEMSETALTTSQHLDPEASEALEYLSEDEIGRAR